MNIEEFVNKWDCSLQVWKETNCGIKQLKEDLQSLINQAKTEQKECVWSGNDIFDDREFSYDTSCDNGSTLNEGTTIENNMKYCCFCGGKIREG